MKKVWIGIGIVVLVVFFIGINIYWFVVLISGSVGQKIQMGGFEEKEILVMVMVFGIFKFLNEQYVFYEVDKGILEDIKVKEGDKVKKGMFLIIYINEQLSLEKEQNQLMVELNQF